MKLIWQIELRMKRMFNCKRTRMDRMNSLINIHFRLSEDVKAVSRPLCGYNSVIMTSCKN